MKKKWVDASVEALELNETAQKYHGNSDDGCLIGHLEHEGENPDPGS